MSRKCVLMLLAAGTCFGSGARPEQALRLVPFPRQVKRGAGELGLREPLVLEVSVGQAARFAASLLADEIEGRLGRAPAIKPLRRGFTFCIALHAAGVEPRMEPLLIPKDGGDEAYALSVTRARLLIQARAAAGLRWGVQTARQLVRANRKGGAIPALDIGDWPALRWRGFQDDITRGPSSLLCTLEREVALGSEAKMNFFTYYLEHQFAFTKHPIIGPKDGSLTPDELRRLVVFARPRGVGIVGCQQSFGHFWQILKHEEFKPLRETPGILCPTKEGAYELLDDLYSEQAPLLPCPMFNVCCDETHGLGKGPSKELAKRIGVGGVYARHMRRVHDLLKDKYGKRMMMWGDIILRHPEHLKEIPRDTIMLTWGYGARPNFESQIIPFAKSGYAFFVCPGVSCWSRILPDFACAATNIAHFVRDGAKHRALGMLNTTWDDDGENFFAPNWHGVLWSAECAWNASTTSLDDFNRRVGAVLFGEKGDHFGQAIELLAKTHALPGFDRMRDSRFWRLNPGRCPVSEAVTRSQAGRLLGLVPPALEHLRQAQVEAQVNADLLDYFIFGARRMELIAQRDIEFLDAAHAYERACEPGADQAEAARLLAQVIAAVTRLRDAHAALKPEYERLWRQENKPYALDRVRARFDRAAKTYDRILARLARATAALGARKPLPDPKAAGMAIVEMGVRRTRPSRILTQPLAPAASWAASGLAQRMGIKVASGRYARMDLPVELDLPRRVASAMKNAALFELDAKTKDQQRLLCQVMRGERPRLIFVANGPFPAKRERAFLLYFGDGRIQPATDPSAVSCKDAAKGMKWIKNDKVRLLVGPEGAHIYRWEVKALKDQDITQPGERNWSGFADLGGRRRNSKNKMEVLSAGPVLARLRCTDDTGLVKTINLYAGAQWAEVLLSAAVNWYWNYDNTKNFAADGPSPGRYLFSDGAGGAVGRAADALRAQVRRNNVTWSAKFRPDGLLLALITPGVGASHCTGPGAGSGGVGIEGSRAPVSHFVTYGGVAANPPKQTLDALERTLSLKGQPEATLCAVQAKPD